MKYVLLVLTFSAMPILFAQTDEFNLEKYWKFRNDFVEKFVKIGNSQGESLPAGKRKPCSCIDNLYLNPLGIPDCYSEMHWGDGMIRHGHYLGFLATEYALMVKYDEDSTATLHELYYALNAINRLDKFAEPFLTPIYNFSSPENINGFYLREDIPEDFASEFSDGDWDMLCTNSAFYHNNNAAKINNPSLSYGPEVKGNSYLNAPSLDQMTSLLVGLSVAHKLVDNVFVQPTPSDTGFYLKTEIELITDRIMTYASDRNWELIDVNGWPVANGGGDLILTAHPMVRCAENMFGGTYNTTMKRKIPAYPTIGDIRICLTGFGVENNDPITTQNACAAANSGFLGTNYANQLLLGVPAGTINNQDASVYQTWSKTNGVTEIDVNSSQSIWSILTPQLYDDFLADWENNNKFDQTLGGTILGSINFKNLQISDYNTLIFFNLGVMSGDWSQNQAHNFANIGDNRQLELVNALLKDQLPIESRSFYKAYLDAMPQTGGYFLQGLAGSAKDSLFASGGWATDYRWANYLDKNQGNGINTEEQGIYNGLDYMYYHNLYYLIFGDQLPIFEKNYNCLCDSPVQKQIPAGASTDQQAAIIGLNKKLEFVGSCVENVFDPVSNDVFGSFVIEPFFSEYSNLGIRPNKYETENATIHSGADVQVQTDFVICNSTTLTTESTSDLNVINGNLVVNPNSILDVSGTLRIKAGSRTMLQNNSRIILRSGAKLIIEDKGKFQVKFEGTLEYYDGAQVILEGANSEFILGGEMKMMNGGTFTLDHSLSSESGRFIIDGNARFSKDINNQAPSFVELEGKDQTDEFIILNNNTGLYVSDATNLGIDKLTIHDCKVRFNENTAMGVFSSFISYKTTYTTDANNAIVFFSSTNNFTKCNFEDVPIYAQLHVENTDKFRATNCKFWSKSNVNEQGRPLVHVLGMGFSINSCEFKGSEHACLRSENLLHKSAISNSTFEHYDGWTPGNTLVGIHDVSNVEVKVLGSSVGQMKYGISKVGGKLSLKCNTFAFNEVNNVLAAFGCRLNLSTDNGAGYNYFYAAGEANIGLQSAMINLRNGRNWFDPNNLFYVKGDLISQCGVNTDCAIDARRNQWNFTYATPPLQSKFDVVGSDNLPFQFAANLAQAIPTCGYYDNGGPIGQSGFPTAGTNNFEMNVPMISLSFNSDISLDGAVEYANELSNSGQDLLAIDIYDEIFDLNLPKDNQTTSWMYQALSGMKSSLENAMFEEDLLKGDNVTVFETHVQSYVDALNYMSDMSIEGVNYKEQFYLEVEKSHLYRMLEIDQMSNEVLANIDVCGLDQDEQAMLNYWKRQYEIDLIVNQIGYAYIDTNVVIDTSAYNTPLSYTPPIFNFGSRINGVYNVSYTNCASGNAKMNALADRPMNQLNVHPNPADKFIEIQFDYGDIEGNAEILITSLDGKEILKMSHDFESSGDSISLDVSNWEQGGYMITIHTQELGILRKQFVVTR